MTLVLVPRGLWPYLASFRCLLSLQELRTKRGAGCRSAFRHGRGACEHQGVHAPRTNQINGLAQLRIDAKLYAYRAGGPTESLNIGLA